MRRLIGLAVITLVACSGEPQIETLPSHEHHDLHLYEDSSLTAGIGLAFDDMRGAWLVTDPGNALGILQTGDAMVSFGGHVLPDAPPRTEGQCVVDPVLRYQLEDLRAKLGNAPTAMVVFTRDGKEHAAEVVRLPTKSLFPKENTLMGPDGRPIHRNVQEIGGHGPCWLCVANPIAFCCGDHSIGFQSCSPQGFFCNLSSSCFVVG